MRMWMIDPKLLCRKHLLGEHSEIHKHRHIFVKGQKIHGRRGQIEPLQMKNRHDELVTEMVSRGYNHLSPFTQPDLSKYNNIHEFVVDREESINDLLQRCPDCAERIKGCSLSYVVD